MRKLQNIYPFAKSQRVSFNNVFFFNILLYCMYISSVIYTSWYWSRLGGIHFGSDSFLTWPTFTGLFTQRPAQLKMELKKRRKKKTKNKEMFNQLLEWQYSETDVDMYIQNGVFSKARKWDDILIRHTWCAEWVNCWFCTYHETATLYADLNWDKSYSFKGDHVVSYIRDMKLSTIFSKALSPSLDVRSECVHHRAMDLVACV